MLRSTGFTPPAPAAAFAVPALPRLNLATTKATNYPGQVYSIDDMMDDYVSVATDATGQYVGTTTQSPAYFYWSSDYGQTFMEYLSPTGSTAKCVSIAADAPNYVAIAGNNGVAVSKDYGNTFQIAVAVGFDWTAVAVSANASVAYAIYSGSSSDTAQIYISTDYLTTFKVLETAPITGYTDIAISSTGQYLYALTYFGNVVYNFNDFGAVYTIVNGKFGSVSSVSSSSTGQYVAITAYFGYLFYSSNYGATWSKSSTTNTGIRLLSVTMSADGEKLAIAADGPSIFLSTNYGKTLTMSSSSAQSWTSIASSADGNSLYGVASQSHIFKSTNAGSTWTPLYYPWYGVASSQSGQYRYALVHSFYDAAVYMSSNNGATWQTINVGEAYEGQLAMACNANCQYVVITTQSNSIFLSFNYGATWTTKTFGSTSVPFVVVSAALSSSGQYITVVTNHGPIYTSSNYGSSFVQVTATPAPTANYWSVAMSSTGQLQLATTVYYSFYNGGKTDGGNVYMSTNYGSTWTMVADLPYAEFWSAVTSDEAGVNLAAAQGYGGTIYISHDSGATWTSTEFTQSNFVAMCQSSAGDVLYVADGGGFGSVFSAGYIYISVDYGKTWNVTTSPSREWARIACDASGQSVTATVYQGQLFTTSDYGESWIPQNITVYSHVDSYSNNDDDAIGTLSGGAIAGIVIGSVVGLALIVGLVAFFVFGVTFGLPCWTTSKNQAPLLQNQM